jgi:excisionase family DNA binding protein
MTEKTMVTLSEVAKMLAVDQETARRWAAEGRFPAFQFGDRARWRAYREDIDEWVRSHQNNRSTGQVEGAQQ